MHRRMDSHASYPTGHLDDQVEVALESSKANRAREMASSSLLPQRNSARILERFITKIIGAPRETDRGVCWAFSYCWEHRQCLRRSATAHDDVRSSG